MSEKLEIGNYVMLAIFELAQVREEQELLAEKRERLNEIIHSAVRDYDVTETVSLTFNEKTVAQVVSQTRTKINQAKLKELYSKAYDACVTTYPLHAIYLKGKAITEADKPKPRHTDLEETM